MKVVIIGAGVAGLAIGWRLVQAGAEVVVLDRAQPGRGATWASAGMLAAIAESSDAPESEARFARQSLGLWPSFAPELEQASGRKLSYRREGALLVAWDESEVPSLKSRAAAAGVPFLSAEDAVAKVPGLVPTIAGALWAPDEAQVDNRALGLALATAYVNAGGVLSTNEAVVRVETRKGGLVAALTPFKLYEADAIVVAAGAWTPTIEGLEDAGPLPVRPVKGEVMALRPSDPSGLPRPLVWGNGLYLVPRGQRLFVGATVSDAGYDTSVTDEARVWLFERAKALMPALADWPIDEQWAGLRPGSADGLPLIGETAIENVFVASGQYRNGILFAPLIGETVRTLVLERVVPPEIAAFDPKRFQN